MNHNLIKEGKGWKCTICNWQWTNKPTIDCPGCPRYDWDEWPPDLKSDRDLQKKNLKPKPGAKPVGSCYLMKIHSWLFLWREEDYEIDDPNLPPVLDWDERSNLGLKTPGELKELNLAPSDEALRNVAWIWDREDECGVWIKLYDPEACQWQPRDEFVTKSQLKSRYLLSDGWIKRLGEPDRKRDNPHGRYAIQLFSRQRVEQFLAENAEKYAKWMDKRDRYLALFEKYREKIQEGQARYQEHKKAIAEQTTLCLQCASGCATECGFLCAIYPMGVPVIPCPDWMDRAQSKI
jgi:hypothetical protein